MDGIRVGKSQREEIDKAEMRGGNSGKRHEKDKKWHERDGDGGRWRDRGEGEGGRDIREREDRERY